MWNLAHSEKRYCSFWKKKKKKKRNGDISITVFELNLMENTCGNLLLMTGYFKQTSKNCDF